MWNDYGDCPGAHDEDGETTLWVLTDGSITRVSHHNDDADRDEHTVLSGVEATEAHTKVNTALAARTGDTAKKDA